MSERGQELAATADRQIAGLIDLLRALDQAALDRPCPGRERLGDGTIGAAARHTADNYERIADFVQTSDRMTAAAHGGHRIPGFLRALGHGPQDHANHDHVATQHDNGYTVENVDLDAVVEQLNGSRAALGRIAELTDGTPNAARIRLNTVRTLARKMLAYDRLDVGRAGRLAAARRRVASASLSPPVGSGTAACVGSVRPTRLNRAAEPRRTAHHRSTAAGGCHRPERRSRS